jgi:chromosome partitioning protein
MPVVVVANPKGGVGKSTLSTQIAGYFASLGYATMLGDADRQQSSRLWLNLRPASAATIGGWDIGPDLIARAPKGTTHLVLDTPAGLKGWRLRDVLKLANGVVVPLQPSVFDVFATKDFVDELLADLRPDQPVGVVGMRVDERALSADKLRDAVSAMGVPLITCLRDTQNYVHLTARGLTVFDVAPGRVDKDLAQWQPLLHWLNAVPHPKPKD